MDVTGDSTTIFSMAKTAKKPEQVVSRLKGPRFKPTFIRQWRKYRNEMTQERLADRVGMSAGNLSNIETGKQPYTQAHLEAIADALRCDVVDLLIRDPTQPEGIWTLWQRAKPAERDQILRVAAALVGQAA